MVRRLNGRLPWLVACAAVLTLALVSPALAQSTGMVRGVVKDAAGKPVEGAKIKIDADANNRPGQEIDPDHIITRLRAAAESTKSECMSAKEVRANGE